MTAAGLARLIRRALFASFAPGVIADLPGEESAFLFTEVPSGRRFRVMAEEVPGEQP
jgi:hypothetical protein